MLPKKAIRTQMLEKRDALSTSKKAAWDHDICQQISQIAVQQKLACLHTYLPMDSEVDLFPVIESLLKEGVKIVTPKSLPKRKLSNLVLHSLEELEEGIFGTRHPANSEEYTGAYELILVPGLAFDLQGNRVGYGAGYYDIFLEGHPDALKLGVCYPFQILNTVPTEPHDILLDGLVYPGKGDS